MFPFSRMSLAQRWVVVIALGVVLRYVGDFIMTSAAPTGWTGYEPLAVRASYFPFGLGRLEQLAVWIGLAAVWTAVSLLVLRDRPAPGRAAAGGQAPSPSTPPDLQR